MENTGLLFFKIFPLLFGAWDVGIFWNYFGAWVTAIYK